MNTSLAHIGGLLLCITLCACGNSGPGDGTGLAPITVGPVSAVSVPATPKAICGPNSRPETDLQGRVTPEDHSSGRAALGFTCNTELVGSYVIPNTIGTVGGFKVERYVDRSGHECAYYDTTLVFPTNLANGQAGVNVLDMSDPAHPVLVTSLTTPAMLSPHESLVLNHKRGLLVSVLGNPGTAPGIIDIYDVSKDCRHPVLQSVTPTGILGHESGMAIDGKTFYASSNLLSTLTAVDIANPQIPQTLAVTDYYTHGLELSDDGNRAYVAGAVTAGTPPALIILDTSDVQSRKVMPAIREVTRFAWQPISVPQNAIPITIKGHPYLVEFDEFGTLKQVGAARIIDIADETHPQVVSNLRLEVHNPEHFDAIRNDVGASNGAGGYCAHYCNVPSRVDPGIVACSMSLSGLRIFDIHDPLRPREIAYFNAPVLPRLIPQTPLVEIPPGASDWPLSSPTFVPERKEIWYTDGYSGFYAVRLTNGVWTTP